MYPPGTQESDYSKFPARFREDAVQEAWVAAVAGDDPLRAARRFVYREKKHERRERAYSQTFNPDHLRQRGGEPEGIPVRVCDLQPRRRSRATVQETSEV